MPRKKKAAETAVSALPAKAMICQPVTLRLDPIPAADPVCGLNPGTSVEILDEVAYSGGAWQLVAFGDVKGWIPAAACRAKNGGPA